VADRPLGRCEPIRASAAIRSRHQKNRASGRLPPPSSFGRRRSCSEIQHVETRYVTTRHVTTRHVTTRHVTTRHVEDSPDRIDSRQRDRSGKLGGTFSRKFSGKSVVTAGVDGAARAVVDTVNDNDNNEPGNDTVDDLTRADGESDGDGRFVARCRIGLRADDWNVSKHTIDSRGVPNHDILDPAVENDRRSSTIDR